MSKSHKKMSPGRRHRQGLSLIEVTVALGLLAFGLLGVAAMQIHAMSHGNKGRHVSTAAMVARDQLENMQRVPFSQIRLKAWGAAEAWMAGVGLVNGDVDISVEAEDGSTQVEQSYAVDWRISQTVPANPDLRNVELAVTWNEPDQSTPKRLVLNTIVVNNRR